MKIIEHKRNGGAIIVEYALVMAIIVVGLAQLCVRPDSPVFQIIRHVYRRMVIVISMPWL